MSSQAIRQGRVKRVGKKEHLQALGRALANLAGKAAAALPGIIGSIVLALRHIRKDCGLACRKYVDRGHCCGNLVSRGCSVLAMARRAVVSTTAKAPLGRVRFQQ